MTRVLALTISTTVSGKTLTPVASVQVFTNALLTRHYFFAFVDVSLAKLTGEAGTFTIA